MLNENTINKNERILKGKEIVKLLNMEFKKAGVLIKKLE